MGATPEGDENPEAAFRTIRESFERALGAGRERCHESSYLIAGREVLVRLVGDAVSRVLTRALAHLRIDRTGRSPALLIEAWDENETGVRSPGCSAHSDYSVPGSTKASDDGRYVAFRQANTKSVLDRSGKHIVTWVSAANQLTQYEVGRPWHSELLLWQRDCGLQPVHAGFIERGNDGIVLGGPGGSGKSTTSLVCMRAGWSYLADDYVALERDEAGGFMGYGLYNSAHLEPQQLLRFPSLVPGAIHGRLAREDKSLVLLSEITGAALSGRAKVRVVALPRVVNSERTTVRRASRGEALLRLAPSSLLLLPYSGLGHAGFQALSELVEAVPAYWLELGRDLEQLPSAVGSLLDQATSR